MGKIIDRVRGREAAALARAIDAQRFHQQCLLNDQLIRDLELRLSFSMWAWLPRLFELAAGFLKRREKR